MQSMIRHLCRIFPILICACGPGMELLLLAPSGPGWKVSLLDLKRGPGNTVEVHGILSSHEAHGPVIAEARFYSDGEFQTIREVVRKQVGGGVSHPNDQEEFHIDTKELFLKPSTGGQELICADIKIDDSNQDEFQKIGCWNWARIE